MAAPGPSPRAIAGPEQDVMERIRRFYQFWLNKQPDAQGVDLEDFDMVLNPGMARRMFRPSLGPFPLRELEN